jgi:hypothetical protein
MDEYIVIIEKFGNRLYYKNGHLHREFGPACVPWELKEEFTGLKDEGLYKKIIRNRSGNYTYNPNNKESYYLEGIGYGKEEFSQIILAKKLQDELNLELKHPQAEKKKLKI